VVERSQEDRREQYGVFSSLEIYANFSLSDTLGRKGTDVTLTVARASRFTAFGLSAFIALATAPFALATTGAFSPGFESRGLNTSGVFGSDYFLQTLAARGRFSVSSSTPEEGSTSMLGGVEGKARNTRQLLDEEGQDFVSDITWMLGYAYYRSGAPDPATGSDVFDDSHAFRFGIAWDIARTFDLIASVTYQVLPAENYSQGVFELNLGYTISLAPKPNRKEIPGDDARAYYLRKAQQEDEIVYPPKQKYPHLRIGALVMFSHHTKSPNDLDSGRPLGTPPLQTTDENLNQAGSGPEISFALNPKLEFRANALFYYYDAQIDQLNAFLGKTTIGLYRKRSGLALASIDDTTALLLTFPYRSFTQSMVYRFTPKTLFEGAIQESTYSGSVGNQYTQWGDMTYSFAGKLSQMLSKKVRVGVEGDYTTASNFQEFVGGFNLGYAF
jgi:hypothetical protein